MSRGNRVVITGIGMLTPYGMGLDVAADAVFEGRSAVTRDSSLKTEHGFDTELVSRISDFDEKELPRSKRRSMSRISLLSVKATEMAIADSGWGSEQVTSVDTGIAYGSTMGGTSAIHDLFKAGGQSGRYTDGVMSTTFLKIMSHTCAANLAVYFNTPGRIAANCTACTSSTQSIGAGYEAIRFGRAKRMICGGAEEYHPAVAAVFDVLRATSRKYNDQPGVSPKPFDKNRDGIVVGEGAATFMLEEMGAAKARGAKIYGEIIGYATNNDASHMTNPSVEGLELCMRQALSDSEVTPDQIDYVNAHATGTEQGDAAEAHAIENIFGSAVPVGSLKGHFGHLMGACGAVETALSLRMMERDLIAPTLNLENPDPACGAVDFVVGSPRKARIDRFIKNSFAFGGVNASLVIARI